MPISIVSTPLIGYKSSVGMANDKTQLQAARMRFSCAFVLISVLFVGCVHRPESRNLAAAREFFREAIGNRMPYGEAEVRLFGLQACVLEESLDAEEGIKSAFYRMNDGRFLQFDYNAREDDDVPVSLVFIKIYDVPHSLLWSWWVGLEDWVSEPLTRLPSQFLPD